MNTYYDCGICGHYHPWKWDGDCREDENRLYYDELPEDAIVLSMEDRVRADGWENR